MDREECLTSSKERGFGKPRESSYFSISRNCQAPLEASVSILQVSFNCGEGAWGKWLSYLLRIEKGESSMEIELDYFLAMF